MSEYRPPQHTGRPQGCQHDTIFAAVELWADMPPSTIVLGEFRYELKKGKRSTLHTKNNSV